MHFLSLKKYCLLCEAFLNAIKAEYSLYGNLYAYTSIMHLSQSTEIICLVSVPLTRPSIILLNE